MKTPEEKKDELVAALRERMADLERVVNVQARAICNISVALGHAPEAWTPESIVEDVKAVVARVPTDWDPEDMLLREGRALRSIDARLSTLVRDLLCVDDNDADELTKAYFQTMLACLNQARGYVQMMRVTQDRVRD